VSGHLADALSALADGELSPADEAAAHAHLAECALCQAELAGVQAARSLVRALPLLDPPSRARRPSRVAGLAAAAMAAAASLVFVATAAAPDEPAAPSVSRLVDVHATSGANADPMTQLTPVAFTSE
jgi:anti-sigma factor RsiW